MHVYLPAAETDSGRHLTIHSVEERMRKLVERCGRFGGTVLMHSLAGGTGAGEWSEPHSCQLYTCDDVDTHN